MASLYEIDREILNCIDEETGEIIDADKLRNLQTDRTHKIENIGLWYKNLISDAEALKAEIGALAERKKRAESKAAQLKALLEEALDGAKFETAKVSMGYRKSKACEIENEAEFIKWAEENDHDEYLIDNSPVPDKTVIKNALKDGAYVPFAEIAEKNNLVIK